MGNTSGKFPPKRCPNFVCFSWIWVTTKLLLFDPLAFPRVSSSFLFIHTVIKQSAYLTVNFPQATNGNELEVVMTVKDKQNLNKNMHFLIIHSHVICGTALYRGTKCKV